MTSIQRLAVLSFVLLCCTERRADRDGLRPAIVRRVAASPSSTSAHAPRVATRTLNDGTEVRVFRWRFELARTQLTIEDLGFTLPLHDALTRRRASLVVNAGFFSPNGQPVGLSFSEGRLISRLREELGGGVMTVRDALGQLHEAERFVLQSSTAFAVQCRPRLVVDGRVNIRRDDGKRADRTALCLSRRGRDLEVIVARSADGAGLGGPTLWVFARWLVEMGCHDALNLDGGPSTGVAWLDQGAVQSLAPRGPVRQAIAFVIRPVP